MKNEEKSINNALNEFFSPSFDNQLSERIEKSNVDDVVISLDAQRILDNLPDFEVLQKSYLVILSKENKFFLN